MSCDCPITGRVQGQVGCALEHPGLVEGVWAHGRGLEGAVSLSSLPNHSVVFLCVSMISHLLFVILLLSAAQESCWPPLLASGSLCVPTAPRETLSTLGLEGGGAETTLRNVWACRVLEQVTCVSQNSFTEDVPVWGSISASEEGRRNHDIHPVESSTCSGLLSALCSDESPWKHWNKTIRMSWLLPVFLSSQSVAGVMKANVAHWATFYSGAYCEGWDTY